MTSPEPSVRAGADAPIVVDPAMIKVYGLVGKLAAVGMPVLIMGETGCGKELIATSIHAQSARATKVLISVNCAALHEALVESELFGHEKGSFSGATATRPGFIEAASGSTLFLDEVGELSPTTQAKLLRVLETQRVTRVGDTREREVDVRVVAATNCDLEADVGAGRFRRDSYFRLAAATIFLPPLRERPSEIAALANRFLTEARGGTGRPIMRISDEALAALQAHAWPGNIRELKNVMQYISATVLADVVDVDHVAALLGQPLPSPGPGVTTAAALGERRFRPLADEIRELEVARIREALEATGGNQTRAAALLSMPIRTLFAKAKQYGLARGRARPSNGGVPITAAPASELAENTEKEDPS